MDFQGTISRTPDGQRTQLTRYGVLNMLLAVRYVTFATPFSFFMSLLDPARCEFVPLYCGMGFFVLTITKTACIMGL
mgnify:CR=1 FL=1